MAGSKKKSGLGAESYFANLPSLTAEPETQTPAQRQATHTVESDTQNPDGMKVRKTYALRAETHLVLEEIRLAERKRGRNVTLGDLMEEAVQLLIKEKSY